MRPQLEKRYIGEPLTVDPTARKVVGYPSVFNSPSQDLGGFIEIVRPGAFDATLRNNPDIPALVNHDDGKVVGRTKAGTLKLGTDPKGLRAELDLPDTTSGRDLAESMRRGDVDGCSFAFRVRPGGEKWTRSGGQTIRELTDLELVEVSVGVCFPAYPDASAAVRSMKEWEGEHRHKLREYRQRLAELA